MISSKRPTKIYAVCVLTVFLLQCDACALHCDAGRDGKRAPFDFVPGDGLVQECHIHSDQVYHRFPMRAPKCRYIPDLSNDPTVILRRPKGLAAKGYAPDKPIDRTVAGYQKYSVFRL